MNILSNIKYIGRYFEQGKDIITSAYAADEEIKNKLKIVVDILKDKLNNDSDFNQNEYNHFMTDLKSMPISVFESYYSIIYEIISLPKSEIHEVINNLSNKFGINKLKENHNFIISDVVTLINEMNSKHLCMGRKFLTLSNNLDEIEHELLLENIRNNDSETIETVLKEYRNWYNQFDQNTNIEKDFYQLFNSMEKEIISNVYNHICYSLNKIKAKKSKEMNNAFKQIHQNSSNRSSFMHYYKKK